MKLNKDRLIAFIFLFILFFTKDFYEEYRLFLIYVPVYISILYLSLKEYCSDYSILRFSSCKKWIYNNILLISKHSIIASMILCFDKEFISTTGDMQIVLLYIEYFLFFFLLSGILILPWLNIMRSIFSSILVLIIIKTKFLRFSILSPLYDGRQFNIDNGILETIIFLLICNLIIYTIYFIFINRKVRICGYDAFKKSNGSYFNSNNITNS